MAWDTGTPDLTTFEPVGVAGVFHGGGGHIKDDNSWMVNLHNPPEEEIRS